MAWSIIMIASYVVGKAFAKVLNLVELVFDMGWFCYGLDMSIVISRAVKQMVEVGQQAEDAGIDMSEYWKSIAPLRAVNAFLWITTIGLLASLALSFLNCYKCSEASKDSAAA